MKKLLCLLLAILMVCVITACAKTPEDAQDVLKVGYSQFEGLFSPFYAETVADRDVLPQIVRTAQKHPWQEILSFKRSGVA